MIPDEYPGSRILWENALRTNKIMYDGDKPVSTLPVNNYPLLSKQDVDDFTYQAERAYLLALWKQLGERQDHIRSLREQCWANEKLRGYENGFDRILDDQNVKGGHIRNGNI